MNRTGVPDLLRKQWESQRCGLGFEYSVFRRPDGAIGSRISFKP